MHRGAGLTGSVDSTGDSNNSSLSALQGYRPHRRPIERAFVSRHRATPAPKNPHVQGTKRVPGFIHPPLQRPERVVNFPVVAGIPTIRGARMCPTLASSVLSSKWIRLQFKQCIRTRFRMPRSVNQVGIINNVHRAFVQTLPSPK